MRNIKNSAKNQGYKTESKTILKLKMLVREFREKNLFYCEHSKFATYIPREYLDVFKEEIVEYSKAWIRMQQKNMSSEKNPGIEGHANTRGLHVMDTAINSELAARELQLNEDLAFIGGLIHDIAHTSFAHEGEHFLSEYLQKNGICELHHSSLARLMLEIEGVHEKVLKRLEEKKGRELTKRERQKFKSAFLSISDIAVCHNGEGGLTEVKINRDKTDDDIEEEYINTFVKKGLDRQTRNRTKEGAIVLFCDPISYVAKDFRDGIIKGLVDVNNSEYEDIFIRMGLSKEQLDSWRTEGNKKDKIVSWITRNLRDDLVHNSIGIDGIKMDKEKAELMYEFRDLNYNKIVKPGLRKLNDILPERIGQLIDKYSDMLIKYENGEVNVDFGANKYRLKMLNKFTTKKSPKVEKIYSKITRKGIVENVINEVEDVIKETDEQTKTKRRKRIEEVYSAFTGQDVEENVINEEAENVINDVENVLNNERDNKKTTRRRRIEEDIAELRKDGEITEEVKEAYINRILKEISLSKKESLEMYGKRLQLKYPNIQNQDIEKIFNENQHLRLETYSEALAKLKVAVYIGEATNDFLLDMLEAEGLINEEERKQRYELGGSTEFASITKTMEIQKQEKAKMEEERE